MVNFKRRDVPIQGPIIVAHLHCFELFGSIRAEVRDKEDFSSIIDGVLILPVEGAASTLNKDDLVILVCFLPFFLYTRNNKVGLFELLTALSVVNIGRNYLPDHHFVLMVCT